MSAPDDQSLPTLASVLVGYTRVVKLLAGELGVHVVEEDLGPHSAGYFDGATRTVTINPHAPLERQYLVAHETWATCVFGPDAAPSARRARHLRAVD